MKPTQKPLSDIQSWRSHLTAETNIFDHHELVLAGLHSADDTQDPLTLTFMSPHQSNTDLDDIHHQVSTKLPPYYAHHLVDVRRGKRFSENVPPEITITFSPPAPDENPAAHVWTQWARSCSALHEFGLVPAAIHTDNSGRQLDVILDQLALLHATGEVNIDDLRSQLPRITARLQGTDYENARAFIAPEALSWGQTSTRMILALRLDPADENPDDPADEQPRPRDRRRGWQTTLDRTLVKAYQKFHSTDHVPDGYPASVHRTAAIYSIATATALVAGVAAMTIAGLLYALGQGAAGIGGLVTSTGAAHAVTDPVRSYTQTFLTGPPFDANTMFWLWAAAGATCLLLGAARNIGARIGWCLWGAATLWMSWHGSPTPSQHTAAAFCATWWILGSLLVFRRMHHLINRMRETAAYMRKLATREPGDPDTRGDDPGA